MTLGDVVLNVFSQTSMAVQDHPRLSSVFRASLPYSDQLADITNEAGRLFESVGCLERRTRMCLWCSCSSDSSIPGSLAAAAERTNINKDVRLFRIGMFPRPSSLMPSLTHSARLQKFQSGDIPLNSSRGSNPLGLPGRSRLCCLIFYEDDPARVGHARVHSRCAPNLRRVHSL